MSIKDYTFIAITKLFGKEEELVQGKTPLKFEVSCDACYATMTAFDFMASSQSTIDYVESAGVFICANFVETTNSTVCGSAVKEMGDIIIPVLTNFLLGPDYFCARALGLCTSPKFTIEKVDDYVDRVLAGKPAELKNDDYLNNIYAKIAADTKERSTIKAVQMSDPHIDFLYQ